MSESKSCVGCIFLWRDGSGYSDYTWIDTALKCGKGAHPNLPLDEPDDWEKLPLLAYAEKCDHYSHADDKDPIVISPDGNASGDPDRIGSLLRAILP